VSNNKDLEVKGLVTSSEVDTSGVDNNNNNNNNTNFTRKPKILVLLGVLNYSLLIVELGLYKDSESRGIYSLLVRSKLFKVRFIYINKDPA